MSDLEPHSDKAQRIFDRALQAKLGERADLPAHFDKSQADYQSFVLQNPSAYFYYQPLGLHRLSLAHRHEPELSQRLV